MDKSTFDEKQLKELLQHLPKIKDHQDPEQLFASISSRLEEEKVEKNQMVEQTKKSQKKAWILPVFASAAALLIIALVIPSFMFQSNSSMQDSSKASIESKSEEANESMDQSQILENDNAIMIEGNKSKIEMLDRQIQSHVITDLSEEQQVITVAVPDRNAQFVIPISFIVPKDGQALTKLEQIETIKNHLYEEEWGLSPYILDNVSLSEETMEDDRRKVIVDVPRDHQYGNGSAMEIMFLATIKETFKQLDYDIVEFQTEGKPGIILGNYGELKEIKLQGKNSKRAYFIYQPYEQTQTFLVPFPIENNFANALEAMKSTDEFDLENIKPSIPKEIQFQNIEIDQDKNKVVIEFKDGTDLPNEEAYFMMVEAILMTAKEYGFEFIEFKNAPSSNIGQYNLLEAIEVPEGVNPMPY